ncbi:glycosyltransferase family 2 protein [Sphingomonas solaris]|uniref:glycosyltransferase family 2 protein n=1 Tax=Alterirhizorhabdus solaris TaxID=2529389 RepID=UPI001396AAAB|nr:glycosyltransferase family 2 protein [Sphingomonas solaris]
MEALYGGLIEEAQALRQKHAYLQIADLIRGRRPDATVVERILDDACLSAISDSRQGLLHLAALADDDGGQTPKVSQLFAMLRPALADRLEEANAAAAEVDGSSLRASMLLGLRLALAANSLPRAAVFARLMANGHDKGVRSHPDILPVLNRADAKPTKVATFHRIAICASLKNESDYLEEWVRYHAAIGVDHFYLYNNASTDETADIIARLSTEFSITTHMIEKQPGQTIAMDHFLETHRDETDWVCFIDGDEFINLETATSIAEVIDGFPDAAAVACSWMNFGSNGHVETPAGPCVEAFTRRAASRNAHVKTIARPDRILRMANPHHYVVLGPTVKGDGTPAMILQGKINPPATDLIRINHYIVKSRAQWEMKKSRGRPLPDDHAAKLRSESYFTEYDRNEIEDIDILRLARPVYAGRR